jgi:hypothetical protein
VKPFAARRDHRPPSTDADSRGIVDRGAKPGDVVALDEIGLTLFKAGNIAISVGVGPNVEEATDGRARPAVDFTVGRSGLNAGACFSA